MVNHGREQRKWRKTYKRFERAQRRAYRRKQKSVHQEEWQDNVSSNDPFEEESHGQESKSKRNTALVFIVAGAFLLLQNVVGVFTLIALLLVVVGIKKVRTSDEKKGYVFLGIGILLLVGNHVTFILSIILLSLGFYLIKSRKLQREHAVMHKQSFIESIRWESTPWIIKNRSIWSVIAEINMDFSLAIVEQKDTTMMIQGVIGDIDLIIPADGDFAVSIEAYTTVGQVDIASEKESGVMNKVLWRSANYETSENQVKLLISYIVGDINIRVL